MEYIKEKQPTNWVKELPSSCPECHAMLKDKSFTSKKGEPWEKVACESCSLEWMKSKPKGNSGRVTQNIIMMDRLDSIEKSIKAIDDRLDSLGKWIATNVEKKS